MLHRKSRGPGRVEREALIDSVWPGERERLRRVLRGHRYKADDLNDAFAALWTARRIRNNEAAVLPVLPRKDTHGLRMEIMVGYREEAGPRKVLLLTVNGPGELLAVYSATRALYLLQGGRFRKLNPLSSPEISEEAELAFLLKDRTDEPGWTCRSGRRSRNRKEDAQAVGSKARRSGAPMPPLLSQNL